MRVELPVAVGSLVLSAGLAFFATGGLLRPPTASPGTSSDVVSTIEAVPTAAPGTGPAPSLPPLPGLTAVGLVATGGHLHIGGGGGHVHTGGGHVHTGAKQPAPASPKGGHTPKTTSTPQPKHPPHATPAPTPGVSNTFPFQSAPGTSASSPFQPTRTFPRF